jgi:hypothetical protein
MPEEIFQRALIHLYSNIERVPSYSDALFEEFALTDAERHTLKELMCFQRDGLLTFNRLLHHKRSRSISQALPYSSRLVPGQLDALLRGFAGRPVSEGATDSTEAVRSFAEYVGAEIAGQRQLSRAAELVWFEAMCASVAAPTASSHDACRCPRGLTPNLRMAGTGSAALLRCRFDVSAALQDPSLLDTPDLAHRPCWFFVFPAGGQLRVLAVGAGLASVVESLQTGRPIGVVLASLHDKARRIAVEQSLQRLLSMGAPFVSGEGPDDQ